MYATVGFGVFLISTFMAISLPQTKKKAQVGKREGIQKGIYFFQFVSILSGLITLFLYLYGF